MDTKISSPCSPNISLIVSLVVHVPLLISAIAIITYNYDQNRGEEEGGFFEGDMLLTQEQYLAFTDTNAKNVLRDDVRRWPNSTVYYFLNNVTEKQGKEILKAMDLITTNAPCIQFVKIEERAKRADYVEITDHKDGCFASLGYKTNRATLNVNHVGCGMGKIAHELLHILGMYHMHSSYNRDEYVAICWNNIKEKAKVNFQKVPAEKAWDYGFGYDYDSIMHYPETAFSKNNKPTIWPKNLNVKIGQRDHLSDIDVKKLLAMYCSDSN